MLKLKPSSNSISIVGVLTALVLVAGCVQTQTGDVETARTARVAEQVQVLEPALLHVGLSTESDATDPEQKLQEINDVLGSRSELFNAVGALSSRQYSKAAESEPLGDLIKRVRAENLSVRSADAADAANVNQAFIGLGGAFTEILLRAAEQTIGETNDYDNGKVVTVSVKGMLTDYKLFSDRSGHLENETQFVISVNGVALPTIRFYWIIDVLPETFEVYTHSMNDNDPFPGTLVFSQAMLDRIKDKGFNRKLWAEGEGIKIRKLLIDSGDGLGYQAVPEGHPLLMSDEDSCIDMMFEAMPGGGVPMTYSELLTHSYCLGRCRSPAMVNSK
ncbi:MAG: hypothetical protein AAGF58_06075 [Pseudomonadota bacterium]